MGLKMKTVKDFMGSMVSWITSSTTKITDFNVGSATRTLLEAIAIQLEELYYKMYSHAVWAIENAVYKAFGYEMTDATKATGVVRLEFYQPIAGNLTFPVGVEFTKRRGLGSQIYYTSTSEVTALSGSAYVDLPIACNNKGLIGNTPSNTITVMTTPSSHVKAVYNIDDITNGAEQESIDSRKKRFDSFIKSLAKGNKDSVEYGISTVSGVQGFWVDNKGYGLIRIYAHNSNGELPTELSQEIKRALTNYVSAGVEAVVVPVDRLLVDVSISVKLSRGLESQVSVYESIIRASVIQYMQQLTVSKNLYISDIVHHVRSISTDIVSVDVLLPTESVIILPQQLVRPNSVSVSITVE